MGQIKRVRDLEASSNEAAGISVEEGTERGREHHVRRLKRQWSFVGGA